MKQISLFISDSLHTKFKTYCSSHGWKMKEVLIRIIEKVIKNNDKK